MHMIAKVLAAAALAVLAAPARGQDYPVREIRSVCNFAAGSGADIIVRYYSDRLSRLAGKPVLVENKPGVQGTLASDFVAKSKPDGSTLMITPASSTLATAPYIFKKLPFDPFRDFAPVTSVASLSFVLAVDAAGPIKSIDELVKSLKSKPNHGFYGTGSNTGQVAAELFKEKLGLATVYVPYKVTVDALTGVDAASAAHPHPRSHGGEAPERAPGHPDALRARPGRVRHRAVVRRRGAGRHAAPARRAPRGLVQPDHHERRREAVPRPGRARRLPRLARADGGASPGRSQALGALGEAGEDRAAMSIIRGQSPNLFLRT